MHNLLYNALSEIYPELFPPLKEVPRKLKNIHNEKGPKEPSYFKEYSCSITPHDSWESLVEKISAISSDAKDVSIEVVPNINIVSPLDDTNDEDDYDTNEEDDHDTNENVKFLPPKEIVLTYRAHNPFYDKEMSQYKHQLHNIQSHIENYRKRNLKIKNIESQNKELIRTAIERNKNLWISAARMMKNDPDNFPDNLRNYLKENVCPD